MCQDTGEPGVGEPSAGEPGVGEPGVGEALAMLDRALDVLAAADAGSLPVQVQADALRGLGRAAARQTAISSRVLSVFMAQDGCAADGQGTAKTWLRWQTRITAHAAAAAVGWARRLDAHPAIGAALAAGDLSPSWARLLCAWTERLPEEHRGDAGQILADAARGGADLTDLAGLAEEMLRRAAGPDADPGRQFEDRYLTVGTTWQGAGRVEGDLTPGCAAALTAVIEALARKAGPEDTRTTAQRRHDALEEACRRLIAAGMIPARAGQPAQIMLHLTLSQLRHLPGAAQAEAEWAAAKASEPGWLTGPAADAAACDATFIPVVTGRPDPAALDHLTDTFPAGGSGLDGSGPAGVHSSQAGPASQHTHHAGHPGTGDSPRGPSTTAHPPAAVTSPSSQPSQPRPLTDASRRRLRRALLALAADVLSGPGGLAGWLRTGLATPEAATPSLPLDIAAASDIIPAHLRRAVMTRHRHCAFPGCRQPASICQIHHLLPRSKGGPTALRNLAPLCSFHHLIAVHTWGWQLTLNPNGTTTATSPDGTRTLHSHGPPATAA
jgi:hypothetical protein